VLTVVLQSNDLSSRPLSAPAHASFREILDTMWLFDDQFWRALAKFEEIKVWKNN